MAETHSKAPSKRRKKGQLYIAFVVIALIGGCMPIILSNDFTHEFSIIGSGFNQRLLHDISSNSNTVKDAVPKQDAVPQNRNGPQQKENAVKQAAPKREAMPQKQQKDDDPQKVEPKNSRVAGLDCKPWGGPANDAAAEMVYWEDIPEDSKHVSPFYKPDEPPQYFSFEMDFAGWNNVRMSMETLMGIALAMGRILVIPPAQEVHMLESSDENQKNEFSFNHFFPLEHINEEQDGFGIISMDEYLKLFLEGKFSDKHGKVVFPPGNRTNWDGAAEEDMNKLNEWLRDVSMRLRWKPNRCIAGFPKSSDPKDLIRLTQDLENLTSAGLPDEKDLVGKPPPVDGTSLERMRDLIAKRERLCLYSSKLQKAQRLHFPMMWDEQFGKSRMLTQFYGFLFFQDWKQDLWIKRFMRDHMRYVNEIQCAAARVVSKIRHHVQFRTGGKSNKFYTLHVRRGDFQDQYKMVVVKPQDLFKMTIQRIPENSTVYIATDEENDGYFDVLEKHYNVLYMDDFKKELEGVNSNYMGMIDQLIASRGEVFMGCFYSTFSGYINRLRGYHADNGKLPGYEKGIVESYYYAPDHVFLRMQAYFPVWEPIWGREFPTSWRLIDKDIDQKVSATTKQ